MKLQTALLALRELGLRPLWPYLRYRVGLGSGAYQRSTPGEPWSDQPLSRWLLPGVPSDPAGYAAFRRQQRIPFASSRRNLGSKLAIAQAEAVLRGIFPVFGGMVYERGLPPDWGAFLPPAPDTARYEARVHWSKVDLNALPADVKLVWELSRFGWVYPLARAYAHNRDPRYPEACLKLFDSWMEANPPNCGVQWTSAQEVGFRLLTAAFCLHAFSAWIDERPEPVVKIVRLIAAHAARIPPTTNYAQAQGNNHLLIEATALLTAGLLLPELQRAQEWETLGRRWLERGLQSQFFEDGGYVQFSSNYHRLALECGLWAACVCAAAGKPLTPDSLKALERGAVCLQALVDPSTGQASNFGPNDGAHLLCLTDCVAGDYRPALQLAGLALRGERLYPPGPWDEAARWLGVTLDAVKSSPAQRAPRVRAGVATENILPTKLGFPQAGLYRLDGRNSWALLRCARFRSRPGHSDQLHLDLWWRGTALACDGGTYLYNAAPPWDNSLASAAHHNTIVVDGQDPMLRAGRFLWLRWAQGQVLGKWSSPGAEAQLICAEHDGYRRVGVVHRRSVLHLAPDEWWAVDDLLGLGEHNVCLTWRLVDGPWRAEQGGVSVQTNVGRVSVRLEGAIGSWELHRAGRRLNGTGDNEPTRGWESPTYSLLRPAVELVVRAEGPLPLRLITRFGLGEARPDPMHIVWRDAGGLPPLRVLERGKLRWEL